MHHHDVDRMADERRPPTNVEPGSSSRIGLSGLASGVAVALRHGPDPPRSRQSFGQDHSVLGGGPTRTGHGAVRLYGSGSTLDPGGTGAASIATLWWVMLAGGRLLPR